MYYRLKELETISLPRCSVDEDMQQRSPNVSQEVMETVASELSTDVLELPPLYVSLDPDALDKLIQSMSDGQVWFTYAGQRITVNSRGEVELANNRYSGEQAADA